MHLVFVVDVDGSASTTACFGILTSHERYRYWPRADQILV